MDHDRLFKELLTAFFADFLDLFVPELSASLDRTTCGSVRWRPCFSTQKAIDS
jgi:hypothetical protein